MTNKNLLYINKKNSLDTKYFLFEIRHEAVEYTYYISSAE